MMNSAFLPLRIHVRPTGVTRQKACYALSLLMDHLGYPWELHEDIRRAQIAYVQAEGRDAVPETAVLLRYESPGDWDDPRVRVVSSPGLRLLAPMDGRSPPNAAGGTAGTRIELPDLVFSTYAFATGVLEQTWLKQPWGVPIARGSLADKESLLATPWIPEYARLLGDELKKRFPGLPEPVPKWPPGKKFAVVLSHDVDRPLQWSGVRHYLARARKSWNQGLRRYAFLNLRGALWRAIWSPYRWLRTNFADPNLLFDAWREWEASFQVPGTFFVAVTSAAQPGSAAFDVPYDADNAAVLRSLRRTVAAGWEVELHASINSKNSAEQLAREKRRLEDLLEHPVTGVRHHYWSVDPECPERTMDRHAEVGFEYDSSLGLSDLPGFRRGTCLPFTPFWREANREVNLLQLPPTAMDAGLFRPQMSVSAAQAALQAHFDAVAGVGGAAILNWHLESLNPHCANGAGALLVQALTPWLRDESIYWTSLGSLQKWWVERRARVAALANPR